MPTLHPFPSNTHPPSAQHDDELDIYAGEHLFVLEDNGTGWVKAKRNDNEIGLVPGNYIELFT